LKQIPNIHSECRLVPLNKKNLQIPTRTDMKPIVITSPLVKLIEASLLPDLTDYLVHNLHAAQIGFVPGNGIFVNIHRAIERVKLRTSQGRRCFGVLVDFSSAYNTIDHEILFSRLRPILWPEKTQLIKSLYSRLRISLGKESIIPNQDVAQGSVISTALFDIYSENLFYKLENELH